MAWEWIGTAAVGIAGIGVTYWQGRESREAQERVARTGRLTDRRADAYVEMLHAANMIGEWSQRLRPAIAVEPPHADFKIGLHLQTVKDHGPGTSGIDQLEVWQELEDVLRPAEVSARDALEKQANDEMTK